MTIAPLLAIALCLPGVTQPGPAPLPAADTTASGLAWDASGTGPPVVLVHGTNLDRRIWDDVAAILAPTRTAIRYDLRSHGHSRDADGPWSDVADLAEVMDAAGAGSALLVGLSAGSGIALEFALAHPDRVDGLVLVSPSIRGFVPQPGDVPDVFGPLMAALPTGDEDAIGEALLGLPTFDVGPEHAGRVSTLVRDNLRLFRVDPAWAAGPPRPPLDHLAEVTAPTVVVWGSADFPAVDRLARSLVEALPRVWADPVEGGPHLLPLTHPSRVARALTLLPDDAVDRSPPVTPSEADIPRPMPVQPSLAGAPLPDISRFLNVRNASNPSPSPDGTRLAFSTSITGSPQLWVVDARGGWPRQLTYGESVTYHRWSPSGDWILYASDRGGDEREGYWLISPDGTRERELLAPSDAFRSFGAFTRDGSSIVYATTERNGVDFDIHLLDVASGDDRELFRGRMGLYPESFRPDGGAVLLTEARGEDANDLYLFGVASGRLDTLFAAATPDERNAYGSTSWLPDGSGFYLVTDHERDHAALARYDIESRRLEWIRSGELPVDAAALSADGGRLFYTLNEGGYSSIHVIDLETGDEMAVPPELPRGVVQARWADDAPLLALRVTGPGLPGDIWTWHVETGAVHRATESSMAGLDPDAMVAPEPVSFPARDGLTLYGLLYRPTDVPEGARPPVLLHVHGGPTAQARPGFNPVIQYLLTRGIAVLDLDYRGSTGHGKAFARANDGRKRAVEYLDMADALDFLVADGRVDAGRAAVMGGSYGGYLTMAAVTRLASRFRAGVAFVGVSDWVTALEGASPSLKASDRIEYGDIDDPEDRAFFRTISPLEYVDGDEAPVMVLHGANDPRDPVTESDRFVQAIRERGGEVEYLRFPDEGHGIRRLDNRLTAYRRIAEFLERRLGVVRPPVSEEP